MITVAMKLTELWTGPWRSGAPRGSVDDNNDNDNSDDEGAIGAKGPRGFGRDYHDLVAALYMKIAIMITVAMKLTGSCCGWFRGDLVAHAAL